MNMLKTVTTIALAFAFLNGFARADNNAEDRGNKGFLDDKKVAIVYYSHSGETYSSTGKYPKLKKGNTEVVAENLAKSIKSATVFQLKTVEKYPEKYSDMTQYVKEQQEKNILPELQDLPDVSEYDIIFVGTPVWWGKMSLPVASFLKNAQLNGKVIIPFITHEGSGESGIGEAIKQASGCQKVLPALIIKGSEASTSENAVKKFIDDLKA